MLTSAKLRRPWYQKVHFLKLHICVYLGTKFQVSSIILTSFRKGGVILPPITQNEPLKSPPRLGLKPQQQMWDISQGVRSLGV